MTAPSRARYMPSSRPLTVTLVAEAATGRVLGAEAVGVDAVDKYIDTVAACLWGGLTVDAWRIWISLMPLPSRLYPRRSRSWRRPPRKQLPLASRHRHGVG